MQIVTVQMESFHRFTEERSARLVGALQDLPGRRLTGIAVHDRTKARPSDLLSLLSAQPDPMQAEVVSGSPQGRGLTLDLSIHRGSWMRTGVDDEAWTAPAISWISGLIWGDDLSEEHLTELMSMLADAFCCSSAVIMDTRDWYPYFTTDAEVEAALGIALDPERIRALYCFDRAFQARHPVLDSFAWSQMTPGGRLIVAAGTGSLGPGRAESQGSLSGLPRAVHEGTLKEPLLDDGSPTHEDLQAQDPLRQPFPAGAIRRPASSSEAPSPMDEPCVESAEPWLEADWAAQLEAAGIDSDEVWSTNADLWEAPELLRAIRAACGADAEDAGAPELGDDLAAADDGAQGLEILAGGAVAIAWSIEDDEVIVRVYGAVDENDIEGALERAGL